MKRGAWLVISLVVLAGCSEGAPTAPTNLRYTVDHIALRVRSSDPVRPNQPPMVVTVETWNPYNWGAPEQVVDLAARGGVLDRARVVTDEGGVAEVRAWPSGDGPMFVMARQGQIGLVLEFRSWLIGSYLMDYHPLSSWEAR